MCWTTTRRSSPQLPPSQAGLLRTGRVLPRHPVIADLVPGTRTSTLVPDIEADVRIRALLAVDRVPDHLVVVPLAMKIPTCPGFSSVLYRAIDVAPARVTHGDT